MKADLRGKAGVSRKLAQAKKTFKELKARDRLFFDKESFLNPYADTRILFGDRKTQVRRILVGIDIDTAEILLADRLDERGKKVDLILAHHPKGLALARLPDVMDLQIEHLEQSGLSPQVAKDLMDKRIHQVRRGVHSANHDRSVDTARLLGIPLMCCHTPTDNLVNAFLQKKMNIQKPKTLQQIMDILLKEPEYRYAAAGQAGPEILIGKNTDRARKVLVDMTGGTEGSKDVFGRLSQAGTNTLLCMHLSEEHFNRAKTEFIHVVNAGHIASDNLGINLMLDELERHEDFEIIACSGFRRVKRK